MKMLKRLHNPKYSGWNWIKNHSFKIIHNGLQWLRQHIDASRTNMLLITLAAGLLVVYLPKTIVYFRCYTRPYITFESDFTQVFHLSDTVPTLEYSVGESRWKPLVTQNIVFGGTRGKLLLRGRSCVGTNGAIISFASNAEVVCTGDIRTLVDYKNYDKAETSEAKFRFLFKNCKQLVTAPELPTEDLAESCYMYMFSRCTSLQTAPELPALKLAKECYTGMFSGCTSLENPPELRAMKMDYRCYSSMFSGCTSLKGLPRLPATTLAESCYAAMFMDCTSLTWVPRLQADTLAKMCYMSMFAGCTSLKFVAELPAMNLAEMCYFSMFSNCTSLETTPRILPAKIMASNCYASMFSNCTSLKRSPVLPAERLTFSCYSHMFEGCTSLSEITMLAPRIVQLNCINWVEDVHSSGVFYINKDAQWINDSIVPQDLRFSTHIIPPGWTVELIDPEDKNAKPYLFEGHISK